MIPLVEKEEILEEVWRIRKKGDQLRSFHGVISDKIRFWNKAATIYVTIGTSVGTTVIFAKIPDCYFLVFGLYSASVFIVSLLPPALNTMKMLEDHTNAVNILSSWIRDCEHFGNIEISDLTKEQALNKQKELIESYKNIIQKIPIIDNEKFLRLKQKHLQKIAISRELDRRPFDSIRKIKIRLANNHTV